MKDWSLYVEVVALGVELNREPDLSLSAFTLPLTCQPLQGQPVEQEVKNYPAFRDSNLLTFVPNERVGDWLHH